MRRPAHSLAWLAAAIIAGCGATPSIAPFGSPAANGTAVASVEPSPGPSIDPSLLGAPFGRDPLLPTLGNGGYDVASYDIDVETDLLDNQTTMRVAIEAVATQPLGAFSLDYSGIVPGSVRVDDVDAAFSESAGKLMVTPARSIDDGAAFQVVVDIAGRPSAVRGNGWAWREAEQLSAFGTYDLLPTWLPFNAEPADKALFTARIRVPLPYTAVAPGVLVSTTELAAGREFEWRGGPSSTVSIVIRDYQVADLGTVAGVPLTSYEPEDLPSRQRAVLDGIPAIFEYLTEVYGPFPFESLSIVWVDGLSDMEGPDEGLLKWGPARLEPTALAHHLTHIWFAVNVTPRTSRESYLRAAFANYADILWVERSEGVEARDQVLAAMHAQLGARSEPPANPLRIAGNPALFIRGPLSLHALRTIVGDETFFEILRTWVVRFHRQAASVDDFVALAEEIGDRSLEDWQQGWLQEELVPPLSDLALR